jgi:primosomal protein N' (replication factor Y) (superfamily II helicase)
MTPRRSPVRGNMAAPDRESSASPQTQYALVAVPLHLNQTFTYRLPPALQQDARIGSRILVPFGTKPITGYIVALQDRLDASSGELLESEIKNALALLDTEPLITPEVLEITRWVADYYAAPWGEVLKAALPAGINATVEQIVCITAAGRQKLAESDPGVKTPAKIKALRLLADEGDFDLKTFCLRMGVASVPGWLREIEREGLVKRAYRNRTDIAGSKVQKVVRLPSLAEVAAPLALKKLTTKQQDVLNALQTSPNKQQPLASLLRETGANPSTVRSLEKKGLVEIFDQELRRDPLQAANLPAIENLKLTEAQKIALDSVLAQMNAGRFATFLLHGVTGSGKTEIYIQAMRAALKKGYSAMMLVPEIALTPILSRRLRASFGDQIALFHSTLTKGERFDEWSRLRRGEARIVIGTRSAVFAPAAKLGLIIIDEEHDTSYRQQDSPYYNARDTAIVRARKEGAVVVLGSATPSLESFHNAQTKKYRYLQLPERIGQRAMAQTELVDMREVFAAHGKPVVFSDQLLEAIQRTHDRGEQSMILLNRRGYSSFVLCRSCGESIQCPNCDVTLTYHRSERTLVCHYCNFRQPAPTACPTCEGTFIYYVGEGTEQIEEQLRQRFPALRIARIDRDTTSRRRVFEQALLEFGAGKLDMLVGTQMLAKGHDFPNVTLVGVVSVDAGLALPDFRSAERTFQLLTQVAGRAGRGNLAGRVIIQTYHPDHYVLRHARAQDYAGFYAEEIRYRRNHSYPPFVVLGLILIHNEDLRRTQAAALALKKALDAANVDRECRILGPAPAPLARLRGEHRMQILIKSRSRPALRRIADAALAQAEASGHDLRSINLEIDPVSLM